jgi:RimJ/RimL family protein N-acetyltransferase
MLLTEDVVVLRPPKPDDAPRLADAVRASLTTLSAWMPWATPDYSAESALEWMVDARVAGRCPFVIVDPAGNVVGSCGLQNAGPVSPGYGAHRGRPTGSSAFRSGFVLVPACRRPGEDGSVPLCS